MLCTLWTKTKLSYLIILFNNRKTPNNPNITVMGLSLITKFENDTSPIRSSSGWRDLTLLSMQCSLICFTNSLHYLLWPFPLIAKRNTRFPCCHEEWHCLRNTRLLKTQFKPYHPGSSTSFATVLFTTTGQPPFLSWLFIIQSLAALKWPTIGDMHVWHTWEDTLTAACGG